MSGWSKHSGQLVHLALDNVDTDQIIPARFMSQPRVQGYAEFLFHDLRRDSAGDMSADFPLNRHSEASILLCGENFGTGSSREAAAYALLDAGIKVVVATSYGDIFAANAVNNGLLPAIIDKSDKKQLHETLSDVGALDCSVDLELCQLSFAGQTIKFAIDETWRTKLINGWDDIDMTRLHVDAISAFATHRRQLFSWAWPAQT
ncbi:MAG: 3-isopropylmalate dehydratase small subunit [Granulosicoccus sp.]